MKPTQNASGKPPFSYAVKVGHVSANPVVVTLEASPEERKGLAELWRVASVEVVTAELQIARWKKDGVRIRGRVHAELTQSCVVTLEPVVAVIDEELEQIFVPEGSKLARIVTNDTGEMLVDPDGPDLPEMFSGDTIDAGEVVAEFAALAIDPYPRKTGIEFSDHLEGDPNEKSGKPNPFAALKDWKKD